MSKESRDVYPGFCAIVIDITLFKDLTARDAIVAACMVIVLLIFSGIAPKQKSIDADVLDQGEEDIVKAALSANV